ncbi:MAG: molybdopterin-dependent oxidoreductase [Dehalococcoidales bacterium]
MNKDHSEKTQNEETKKTSEVTRRDFLVGAGTVVVGGAVGAGLLSGCGETVTTTVKETTTKTVPTTIGTTVTETKTVAGEDGEVITVTETKTVDGGGGTSPYLEPEETIALYNHNGLSAAEVKNGKIVRSRPWHFDDSVQPFTINARGQTFQAPKKSPIASFVMTYYKRQDSPNRILYPIQRVDWEPGGDPAKINAQNRGKSLYKRISWDDASTIIANELKRVADTYGVSAISDVYSGGHNEPKNVTNSSGIHTNFMQYWALSEYGEPITEHHGAATTSAGGQLGGRYVWGFDYEGNPKTHDISENTEMMLGWACDSTKSWIQPYGTTQQMVHKWWNKIGIKQIHIDPHLTHTGALYASKWIPVHTRTDCALMAAIAYVWFTEDTYNKEYIASHAYGFDKWEAYVMGTDDEGVAKTPEWASPLCGVPVYTIKALARAWANKTTSIMNGRRGGGCCRGLYSEGSTRMWIYLLGMQGWGGPGVHYIGMYDDIIQGSAPVSTVVTTQRPSTDITNKQVAETGVRLSGNDTDRQFVPRDLIWKAVTAPPVEWWSTGDQFNKRTYPMEGKSEIHMIWGAGFGYTGSRIAGFKTLAAFRSPKLECIVGANMFMEDGMCMCDIILPIEVITETEDIFSVSDTASHLVLQKKVLTTRGEAKSDYEAIKAVAEKLGYGDKLTDREDDTPAGRVRAAYDAANLSDSISWEDLNEKLVWTQSRDPNWQEAAPASRGFYDNPSANPLRTPSGLLEYESQLLLENHPDDMERQPVAKYIRGGPASEGWTHDEDRLLSERANDYPLLLNVSTRRWGRHSQHSDIPWTREIKYKIGFDGYAYSECWINPKDAEARGIKDGDLVKLYNERGIVLAVAELSERAMEGDVYLEKAGGGDFIDIASINRGGNGNCISPDWVMSYRSYGINGFGFLIDVAKVSGEEYMGWKETYPEAFERKYDPKYGPIFEGWIEGGN